MPFYSYTFDAKIWHQVREEQKRNPIPVKYLYECCLTLEELVLAALASLESEYWDRISYLPLP